jgi:hypothetical protein
MTIVPDEHTLEPSPSGISRRRDRGIDEGKGWIADDFDAPLSADLQALFEGSREVRVRQE